MTVTKEKLLDILKDVPDPEIPVITIEELGILHDVIINDDKILVLITPTYNGCPAMDMISVNIKSCLQDHGFHNVEVKIVLEPIWTTDRMSHTAKLKLKAYGIAPPSQKTTDAAFLMGLQPIVICPRCESSDTEMVSRFGSTACKSLYKCLNCKESFDYFKCH